MTAKQTRPDYLTASQAAAYFHVSAKTIGRWAREGKVPFLATLGGHRRYLKADLDALIAANTERPAQ